MSETSRTFLEKFIYQARMNKLDSDQFRTMTELVDKSLFESPLGTLLQWRSHLFTEGGLRWLSTLDPSKTVKEFLEYYFDREGTIANVDKAKLRTFFVTRLMFSLECQKCEARIDSEVATKKEVFERCERGEAAFLKQYQSVCRICFGQAQNDYRSFIGREIGEYFGNFEACDEEDLKTPVELSLGDFEWIRRLSKSNLFSRNVTGDEISLHFDWRDFQTYRSSRIELIDEEVERLYGLNIGRASFYKVTNDGFSVTFSIRPSTLYIDPINEPEGSLHLLKGLLWKQVEGFFQERFPQRYDLFANSYEDEIKDTLASVSPNHLSLVFWMTENYYLRLKNEDVRGLLLLNKLKSYFRSKLEKVPRGEFKSAEHYDHSLLEVWPEYYDVCKAMLPQADHRTYKRIPPFEIVNQLKSTATASD